MYRLGCIVFAIFLAGRACSVMLARPNRKNTDASKIGDESYLSEPGLLLRSRIMALGECRSQFKWDRWDCQVPQHFYSGTYVSTFAFSTKVTREIAYVQAVLSAAVSYQILTGCLRMGLPECPCASMASRDGMDARNPSDLYALNVCQADVSRFAVQYSKKILDSYLDKAAGRGYSEYIVAEKINHAVGRMALRQVMLTSCKCHGVSGSCVSQHCWQVAPDFKKVGDSIKRAYLDARRTKDAQTTWNVYYSLQNSEQLSFGVTHAPAMTLLYLDASPDYCTSHPKLGFEVNSTRICWSDETDLNRCAHLCSSCGYQVLTHKRMRKEKCNCRFNWCCQVQCSVCRHNKTHSTCGQTMYR